MSDEFVLLYPRAAIPGCAVVIARSSRADAVRSLEASAERRRYIAKAFITDHIPLTGDLPDVMEAKVPRLVQLDKSPLSIYLHAGGTNAIYYDLCADADGYLKHVDVEIEGTAPGNVLGPARTAINDVLDKLVGRSWMPLTIGRLDLHLKSDDKPLLHQFLMPFAGALHLGPLGGMDRIPYFDPYESLIREAINSPSPFYRFLCAYRTYDGLNELRRTIREVCKKAAVTAKLPADAPVAVEMLKQLGFPPEFVAGIRTVNDLHGKLTDARNRIAHFLLKGAKSVVSTSDGDFYMDYALNGALLLHYAHTCLVDLRRFWVEHLDETVRMGQILPLVERRDDFVVRTD
jgi:hypothetical protein